MKQNSYYGIRRNVLVVNIVIFDVGGMKPNYGVD